MLNCYHLYHHLLTSIFHIIVIITSYFSDPRSKLLSIAGSRSVGSVIIVHGYNFYMFQCFMNFLQKY